MTHWPPSDFTSVYIQQYFSLTWILQQRMSPVNRSERAQYPKLEFDAFTLFCLAPLGMSLTERGPGNLINLCHIDLSPLHSFITITTTPKTSATSIATTTTHCYYHLPTTTTPHGQFFSCNEFAFARNEVFEYSES